MPEHSLSRMERIVLVGAQNSPRDSLISLRHELGINVDVFAQSIASLVQKEYLTRNGIKFQVTSQGYAILNKSSERGSAKTAGEYMREISAPRLEVTEFYLPNREKFLAEFLKLR